MQYYMKPVETYPLNVRNEVFIAMKTEVLVMTPCGDVVGYQRFRGP